MLKIKSKIPITSSIVLKVNTSQKLFLNYSAEALFIQVAAISKAGYNPHFSLVLIIFLVQDKSSLVSIRSTFTNEAICVSATIL